MKNRNVLVVATTLCLAMALLWLFSGPTLAHPEALPGACCLADGSCLQAENDSHCYDTLHGISFHPEEECSEVNCAEPVGGHTEPVSRLTLAWPWLALAAAVTTGTAALVTFKRRLA